LIGRQAVGYLQPMVRTDLSPLAVARLNSSDVPDVVSVLCEAFFDYPVMRHVLGEVGDYARRLNVLIGMFVAARALREDPIFGIRDSAALVAAMTTSNPAEAPHPDFAAVQAAAWQRLGADAQARYDSCVQAWNSIALAEPQLHVNMIGVRDRYRGTGLAGRLLDEVHGLCEQSTFAQGVSLTTEVTRNVDFYRRRGYEVTGEMRITDALTTWNMFRPAR
jgi:GNAT superfamily N-acetyltransferase